MVPNELDNFKLNVIFCLGLFQDKQTSNQAGGLVLSMTNLLERMMAGRQICELHFEQCRNNVIKLQLNHYQLATLRKMGGGQLIERPWARMSLNFTAISESAKK